jgi:hypothetical protein
MFHDHQHIKQPEGRRRNHAESQAMMAAACDFIRYFRTVRGDTRRPSLSRSSLAMRSSPHEGFSRGDHGAKTAAEKRFKAPDGPRVLICTAAGREGINLQHARVLFNFDLPWNPMDLEQRIGRIHRYGQGDTAQIYNLVLSDTIEGSIFLLLDEKLTEIGRATQKI